MIYVRVESGERKKRKEKMKDVEEKVRERDKSGPLWTQSRIDS